MTWDSSRKWVNAFAMLANKWLHLQAKVFVMELSF